MNLKSNRKKETPEEQSFCQLIRDIYHSSKKKQTIVVVNKIHDSEILFRNYATVIENQIAKGLISIRTYDSLSTSDLDKELFEL